MATVAASVLASAASDHQHRPSANTLVSSPAVLNMQPPVRLVHLGLQENTHASRMQKAEWLVTDVSEGSSLCYPEHALSCVL